MTEVSRLVLDVLKPLEPDIVEVAKALVEAFPSVHVHLLVKEVDAKTETIVVDIEGNDLDLSAIKQTLNSLGASLHSVDEVEVNGTPPKAPD